MVWIRDPRPTRNRLENEGRAGTGDRARPTVRHPVTFSKTPARYPLAPPELNEHGDEIRAWLAKSLSPESATEG